MNISTKAELNFSAFDLTNKEKSDLPLWHHIGIDRERHKNQVANSAADQCLRHTHHVFTVGEASDLGKKLNTAGHRRGNRDCECPSCADARRAGCSNPDRCFKRPGILINKLYNEFIPADEAIPDELPREVNEILARDEGWILFSKDTRPRDDMSVGANWRLFTEHLAPTLIENDDEPFRFQNNLPAPNTVVEVYTDGSSDKNGETTAQAGAGVWYGEGDPRNRALRVPDILNQRNNAAEMLAIYYAARHSPHNATLCILTD
ncbi:hypothetical protein DL93DRAFT_2069334, partial [Clavulina sp. PMI_390]